MSLSVKNLYKRYGNNWIWKDVSFEAESGQITGIFGPNGSGKTSLLKVLFGSEESNGGSITWNSIDVTKSRETRRNFSFPSSQNKNVWRSIFGPNKQHENDLVATVEKASAAASELLFLDDPFCNIDKTKRGAICRSIKQIVEDKDLTLVLATSDYDEVFDICDRVAVLVGGDVRQTGEPQEVYDWPNSAAVASVVGRMNIFGSRRLTSSKSDHPEFLTLDGEHRLFAEKADVKTLGAINKNISLAIRPENVSISFGASFPEDNLLKAVVTDVKPRGAYTLVELDSNGLKLEALVLRLVGLNVGDECMLGLPPDRIQILAD